MILSTVETVPGQKVTELIGTVSGSTIRARHIGSDILAGLKSIVGGRIRGYEQLMKDSRQQVLQELKEVASEHGADAIIGLRLTTSMVMGGAAELVAYGTMVKLAKK